MGLDEIFATVEKDSGIKMAIDREDESTHLNSYTVYIRYRGPLPATNDVKVDITIKEKICFTPSEVPILRSYEGYADLPDGRIIKAYDLREIAVEKLTALTDKARNEPRDLYDLWYLLTNSDLSFGLLHGELQSKFAFRKRPLVDLSGALAAKRPRFERLWMTRLSHQITDLPEFDTVFRTVHRAVRAARL